MNLYNKPKTVGTVFFLLPVKNLGASHVVLVVKNPPASAGDIRDMNSIPGLGRPPGGGHGNPLQYSCLGNPRDRGAWWAAVCGVTQSRTRLKQLSSNSSSRQQCLLLVLLSFTQQEQNPLFSTDTEADLFIISSGIAHIPFICWVLC